MVFVQYLIFLCEWQWRLLSHPYRTWARGGRGDTPTLTFPLIQPLPEPIRGLRGPKENFGFYPLPDPQKISVFVNFPRFITPPKKNRKKWRNTQLQLFKTVFQKVPPPYPHPILTNLPSPWDEISTPHPKIFWDPLPDLAHVCSHPKWNPFICLLFW